MPTKIEWCQESWNPVTGCTPISEGCRNCYAKRMANRLRGRYGYPADDPFRVIIHPDRLEQPLKWKKPRRIFVCSMSDLFHKDVPIKFISDIMDIILECPHHRFLILTKRPDRMKCVMTGCSKTRIGLQFEYRIPLKNVWLGVTCENQPTADERIPILLQIPAAVRFVSIEPMLSEIWIKSYLNLYEPIGKPGVKIVGADMFGYQQKRFIDWVIVGGESGPGARPMHPDWARSIRDQCQAAGVPFFFKQRGEWSPISWTLDGGYKEERAVKGKKGGDNNLPGYRRSMYRVGKKKAGRILDGRTWDEYPERGLREKD